MSLIEHDLQEILETVYSCKWQLLYTAAEIAYFELNGDLPEWACFIECIDRETDGTLILVHRSNETDN